MFDLIYADAPWQYSRGKGARGASDKHYRTMTLAEVKLLPVKALAEPDAVLLLWATWPMLPEALAVMDAWGFTYKTCAFEWVKTWASTPDKVDWGATQPITGTEILEILDLETVMGMGHYTRANTEPCLLGVRGKGLERVSASVKQVVCTPVGAHSAKPDEVRRRIDAVRPGPSVELFARGHLRRMVVGHEVRRRLTWSGSRWAVTVTEWQAL